MLNMLPSALCIEHDNEFNIELMDGKTGDRSSQEWPGEGKKPQIGVFTEIIRFVSGKCGKARRFTARDGFGGNHFNWAE